MATGIEARSRRQRLRRRSRSWGRWRRRARGRGGTRAHVRGCRPCRRRTVGQHGEQLGGEVGADHDGLGQAGLGDHVGDGDAGRDLQLELEGHGAAGAGDEGLDERVDLALAGAARVVGAGRGGEHAEQSLGGLDLDAEGADDELGEAVAAGPDPHAGALGDLVPAAAGGGLRVEPDRGAAQGPDELARGAGPARGAGAARGARPRRHCPADCPARGVGCHHCLAHRIGARHRLAHRIGARHRLAHRIGARHRLVDRRAAVQGLARER